MVRQNYAVCSIPNSKSAFYNPVYLKQVNRSLPKDEITGMWTGLLKVSHQGKYILQSVLDSLLQDQTLYRQGRVTALLNELIHLNYPIHVVYVTGHWLNVDAVKDMIQAGSF